MPMMRTIPPSLLGQDDKGRAFLSAYRLNALPKTAQDEIKQILLDDRRWKVVEGGWVFDIRNSNT